MKYILEQGTHKKSKSIFIFTGVFLMCLFGYQLFDHLKENEFNSEFPGDWDKVIGIAIGIYLIFRSSVFAVRSRDLFVEVTPDFIKYRVNKKESVQLVNRINISDIITKKGRIEIITNDATSNIILDLNSFRMRDEQKSQILTSINQFS